MRYRIMALGALYAIGVLTLDGDERRALPEAELVLGAHVREVEPIVSSHLDLDTGVGLVVEHVDPGSPSEKCGLQKFDILTQFDDQILVSPIQLGSLIRRGTAGQDLRLEFIRRGEPKVLMVQLPTRNQVLSGVMLKPSENRTTGQGT